METKEVSAGQKQNNRELREQVQKIMEYADPQHVGTWRHKSAIDQMLNMQLIELAKAQTDGAITALNAMLFHLSGKADMVDRNSLVDLIKREKAQLQPPAQEEGE